MKKSAKFIRLLLGMFALVVMALGAFTADESSVNDLLGGGVTIAMAYGLVSVPKDGENPGRPKGKKDQLIIFRWDDIDLDQMPSRDERGVLITGNLVFKPGKTAIALYATPSQTAITEPSDGEDDGKGFIPQLVAHCPGNGLVLREFINNNINQNLGIIVRYCDGTDPDLVGSPCAPMQYNSERSDTKDINKAILTFNAVQSGPCVSVYTGDIPALDTDSGSGSGV